MIEDVLAATSLSGVMARRDAYVEPHARGPRLLGNGIGAHGVQYRTQSGTVAYDKGQRREKQEIWPTSKT